jgi:hypothetical protein
VSVPPGSPTHSIEQLAGPPPHAAVNKPFLLSDGRVELEASLDKAVYGHGEPILVNTAVHNNSGKTVRKIKVSHRLIQLQINCQMHYRNVLDANNYPSLRTIFLHISLNILKYKHPKLFTFWVASTRSILSLKLEL